MKQRPKINRFDRAINLYLQFSKACLVPVLDESQKFFSSISRSLFYKYKQTSLQPDVDGW